MRLFLISLVIVLYFTACDAPRNNPYDPGAENYLQAPPLLGNTTFISMYENFNNRTRLFLQTQLQNPKRNTEVSSLNLNLPGYNYWQMMTGISTSSQIIYELETTLENIDTTLTPQSIVEQDFTIQLITTNVDTFAHKPFNVRRVITETLNPLSPSGSMENGSITFTWEAVDVGFDFTYSIEIYTLQQFGVLKRIDGISADSSSFVLSDATVLNQLDEKSNFWALYITDQLGNSCKSKFKFFDYSQ